MLFCVGHRGIRLLASMAHDVVGLRISVIDGLVRTLFGAVEDFILLIQDILRVINFNGQGVSEVVEKREHFMARNHAIRGHGEAMGLFQVLD